MRVRRITSNIYVQYSFQIIFALIFLHFKNVSQQHYIIITIILQLILKRKAIKALFNINSNIKHYDIRSTIDRRGSSHGKGLHNDEKQGRPTYYIIICPSRIVVPIIRLDLFPTTAERCERVSETMSGRAIAEGVKKTIVPANTAICAIMITNGHVPGICILLLKSYGDFLFDPSNTSRTRGASGFTTKTVFIVN